MGAASNFLGRQSHSKGHFLLALMSVVFMPTAEDDDLKGLLWIQRLHFPYIFVYTHTVYAHAFDYSTE